MSASSSPREPFVLSGQAGRCFSAVGDVCRVLITGAQTGGALFSMEMLVRPGGGPPPHVHGREDEMFFVLEGEIQFTVGDQVVVAGVGSSVFAPRHIPHAFRNASDRLARLLVTASPAGFEDFLAAFARPVASREAEPLPVTPEEIQTLLQVAPQFGIRILA